MNTTPDPSSGDDAERDSDLYLRGLIDAEELVRRARERVQPRQAVTHSNVRRF
ncbi:MAG: hypothetical protein IPK37_04340 [Austwickia sp.]|jgi:hypothetical protein|nr:MAG: hypothetical protein IPK37_04340 [Austwickia sp.]